MMYTETSSEDHYPFSAAFPSIPAHHGLKDPVALFHWMSSRVCIPVLSSSSAPTFMYPMYMTYPAHRPLDTTSGAENSWLPYPAQKLIKPISWRCFPRSRCCMCSTVLLLLLFRCIAHEPCIPHVVDGADACAVEKFVGDEEGEEKEGLWIGT